MQSSSEEARDVLATDTVREQEEYERKAQRLHTLILQTTGRDISSLPSSVKNRLDILAQTAAVLGLDEPSGPAYKAALSKLSSDQLQMHLQLIHLKKAEGELKAAIAVAQSRQKLAASWLKTTDLETETASLERQKRAMAAKAKEYQEELSTITSRSSSEQDSGLTITSLVALQEQLRQKERDLKVLKARLKAFEGLPPNLELAKQELRIARENQIQLMNTREKLLGRMTLGLQ